MINKVLQSQLQGNCMEIETEGLKGTKLCKNFRMPSICVPGLKGK